MDLPSRELAYLRLAQLQKVREEDLNGNEGTGTSKKSDQQRYRGVVILVAWPLPPSCHLILRRSSLFSASNRQDWARSIDYDPKSSGCSHLHADMRCLPDTENQEVDRSLSDVFKDFVVRPADSHNGYDPVERRIQPRRQ
jgi:hypothetical protein